MKKMYFVLVLFITILTSNLSVAQDNYIGEIKMFAGNFAPNGWAFCDGQLLPIAQNTALFSLLGTTYGGNGTTTFALPDLRGRVAMHAGNGPGLSPRALGQQSGVENTTLTISNLPPHSHTVALNANSDLGTSNIPTDNFPANTSTLDKEYATTATTTMGSTTTSSMGSGVSFSNMQPYIVVRFIIALQGIYPTQN